MEIDMTGPTFDWMPEQVLKLFDWAEGRTYITQNNNNLSGWVLVRMRIRGGQAELDAIVARCKPLGGDRWRVEFAGDMVAREDWTDLPGGWSREFASEDEYNTACRMSGCRDSAGRLIFPELPKLGWEQ